MVLVSVVILSVFGRCRVKLLLYRVVSLLIGLVSRCSVVIISVVVSSFFKVFCNVLK